MKTEQRAKESSILRQRICEEILAYGESNREGPDLTLTIDRIFTAFALADYCMAEKKVGGTMKTEMKTCQHCGHTGKGVITRMMYVGGQGYVDRDLCQNQKECWDRWDEQHGIKLGEIGLKLSRRV